jgi:hypothetical protein
MTSPAARSALALALCLLAAGCITTAEQIAERNNQRCTARGYQPNTKEFSDCIAQLETDRSLRLQARHREVVERSAIPPMNDGR